MPLSSLRRRTANETPPPQGEHSSLPPPRLRSATVTGVTPRKSFQSLVGSVSLRKRGATTVVAGAGHGADPRAGRYEDTIPSPRGSVFEQTLNSSQNRSKITPAAYRTPSPRSMKTTAVSSLSQLSKLKSSRSFLETLADVIRAPTALFYKDRQMSEERGRLVNNQVDTSQFDTQDNVGENCTPASPTKSLNSKKSVRFKPGNSIIKEEPRSSPIDIPKPVPILPPVQLATTPLLQLLGEDMPDMIPTGWASHDMPHMIPTGRPRCPPVLWSSVTFRQAKAEAEECLTEDKIRSVMAPDSPTPKASAPTTALAAPMDNPFADPESESELAVSKGTLPSSIVDSYEAASSSIRQTNTILSSLLEHDRHISSPSRPSHSMKGSPATLLPEVRTIPTDDAPESSAFSPSIDEHEADTEDSGEGAARVRHSTPRDRQIDEKWMRKPTLEDIRGRFKHPEDYAASLEDLDPCSDYGCHDDSMCAKATIDPLEDAATKLSTVHLHGSALQQQAGLSPPKKRKFMRFSSDGDPVSPSMFLRNPPWSSELVLRHGRSSSEERLIAFLPCSIPERSSFSEAQSHLEDEDGLLWEHNRNKQDSAYDFLSGVQAAPQPFPGRIVSRETHTSSLAAVPLPLSTEFPTTRHLELESDNYGICSFTDEGPSDEASLPPGYGSRMSSSEFWPQASVFSPFDDEAEFTPSNDFEITSQINHGSESQENANITHTSGQTHDFTPGESCEEAVKMSRGVTPHNASGSNPDVSGAGTPSHTAPLLWSAQPDKVSSESKMTATDTPTRSRATTAASSITIYSRKSRNSVSTDTTEAMEEDEAMCKGLG